MWLAARPSIYYGLDRQIGVVSQNHIQTVRDRDTWAIFKLWTNWHAALDLRLEVNGGHLYRRGSFAWLGEAGAVAQPDLLQRHKKGEVEQVALKISAVDKTTTGYQLAVALPDKDTEASLKDFYESLFNGGAVNDQKGYDFGNESDGYYYAGACWMYGMTLAAGVPASGRLSSHPYDAARAFREHLAHIMTTVDGDGRSHFGYNKSGEWVNDNLHTIFGACAYLLHSGDVAFVRQNLPALEQMLNYFITRRNEQGLFRMDKSGAYWYYDGIPTGGINGFYNAFFYKAALDMAEMEAAAGYADKAQQYRALAKSIKTAFNRVLWRENLPGGPRYVDWIDGGETTYFCDLCQWPPVALGIASKDQAHKLVATADADRPTCEEIRLPRLRRLVCLVARAELGISVWHLHERRHVAEPDVLGNRSSDVRGDSAGAARRLKLFAQRARETSWAGDNTATIRGNTFGEATGGDHEPYLADMVVVAASLIQGIMGVRPTWQRLEVTPCLPAEWPSVAADILYKGRRHHVAIENGKVHIQPLEQVINLPLTWTMDFNLRTAPGGVAATFEHGFPWTLR